MQNRGNVAFTKKLYGKFQFKHSTDKLELSAGFINFHKDKFCQTFVLKKDEFRGKNLLDTGCGPGKHATVLALMGANVLAMDLSPDNIKKARAIKAHYQLKNLEFRVHNFMNPLPNVGFFDLMSAHNWIMHSEDPTVVLKNFVPKLKIGGRIYLNVYHGNTFRFYIAFIARKLLEKRHYALMQELVRYHFPQGFKGFNNPDYISLENIFDDFFAPYVHASNFEIVTSDCLALGLKNITPAPHLPNLYGMDNFDLRIGLEKVREIANLSKLKLSYNRPLDEFETKVPIIKETSRLAQKVIGKLKNSNKPYHVCSFCLGLYQLRASINKETDMNKRYEALSFYLKLCLDNSLKGISYFYDAGTLYKQG